MYVIAAIRRSPISSFCSSTSNCISAGCVGKGRLGERAGKNVVWKRGSVISGFFYGKGLS